MDKPSILVARIYAGTADMDNSYWASFASPASMTVDACGI